MLPSPGVVKYSLWSLDGDRASDPSAKPLLLTKHELFNCCMCQWCQLASVSSPHTHTTNNISVHSSSNYYFFFVVFDVLSSCRMLLTPVPLLMSSLDKNNDGELNFKESWQLIGHLPNKHGRGSANRVSSDTLLQFQACNSLVCVPYS